MVNLMDIVMAAVEEYTRKVVLPAKAMDITGVSQFVPVGETVAWYLFGTEVLTVKGLTPRRPA